VSDRPIDRVLAKLPNAKKSGADKWTAHCPAHDDHNPSLSVEAGEDGKVLLHCFAGCTSEAIVATLGLTMSDLFAGDKKPAKSEKKVHRKIVKTYQYRDLKGALCFETVRFEPKDFLQRRPDPKCPGRWIWDMKGVRRTLYRLPELLASNPREWIIVTEGEKDVESLRTLGFAATTCCGGAGKWHLTDSTPLMKWRVAILPHSDVPGKKHAGQIATSLCGKASELKIVAVPEGCKDISGWIEAHDSQTAPELHDALLAAIDAAPSWSKPSQKKTTWLDACEAKIVTWLWQNVLPLGKLVSISGLSDSGKSTVCIYIAAQLSQGRAFPNSDNEPLLGRTLILSGEDDIEDTLAPRVIAAGGDPARIGCVQGIFSIADVSHLQEELAAHPDIKLIIVDPVSAFLPLVDSNVNSTVRENLEPLRLLAAEHNLTVILVSHHRKFGAGLPARLRISGSSAFGDVCRAAWMIDNVPSDTEKKRFICAKHNLTKSKKGFYFWLRSVDIEIKGQEVSMPVVEFTETIAESADELLNNEVVSDIARAREFLRRVLQPGQSAKAEELIKQAEQEGISVDTLRRAKRALSKEITQEWVGRESRWQRSLL